ncbi:alternative ribosome rescue aminoacyl-tRNA hydrolase ArfB [Acuticoccus sp. MNP-M23]|uniref:alternative ribosome rescue aminoacyl-tRNA hydrolase ArfB n=1 Tax=Acuticoccus sp. MNP-M23 TaxID=3072793 RepID=UPI002814FE89|nr:alternative ribosome rescue aminoacyl-tRNA hydrolase ArfB [Acuticoccus sp. MNP-M23]WMS44697.1 alternative ribosome rescue aminoacyl-tRNA hydrolase ArfB [Acuticoccus sp. MNP-M23]
MIEVTPRIALDESEVEESFIKAAGPGGQKVNTSSTAVQIRFDARRSPSLPNDVAIRLMRIAGSRLTQDGIIVITSRIHRSQPRNREDALGRLVNLIREAAEPPQVRRATKPTKASNRRRLDAKGKRGAIKSMRRSKPRLD